MAMTTVKLAPRSVVDTDPGVGLTDLVGRDDTTTAGRVYMTVQTSAAPYVVFDFDTQAIPAGATIASVELQGMAYTWNQDYILDAFLALSNGVDRAVAQIDKSLGTRMALYTASGVAFTRESLDGARAICQVHLDEARTGYRCMAAQWLQLVVTYTTDRLYLKRNGAWQAVGAAFKKVDGLWLPVAPGDAFEAGKSYGPG